MDDPKQIQSWQNQREKSFPKVLSISAHQKLLVFLVHHDSRWWLVSISLNVLCKRKNNESNVGQQTLKWQSSDPTKMLYKHPQVARHYPEIIPSSLLRMDGKKNLTNTYNWVKRLYKRLACSNSRWTSSSGTRVDPLKLDAGLAGMQWTVEDYRMSAPQTRT